MADKRQVDDTYFRRLFVPLVISLLVIAGIFVIIAAKPGTAVEWSKTQTVLENVMNGGMRRLLRRR
jgi:hypothetical protein